MNDAFNLYAMEVEEQRERESKIETFIDYLSQTDDPNDTDNQWAAARYSGISDFSPAEHIFRRRVGGFHQDGTWSILDSNVVLPKEPRQ
jgi:hypothetical protein